MTNNNQIQLFQTTEGDIQLEVALEQETVWLSQAQMCELFARERSVITKRINNIFKEGELMRDSVCAKFAHTVSDGKTYQTQHFLSKPVEALVNDNTLVALALLVAESKPEQKELIIRLIQQFILLKD